MSLPVIVPTLICRDGRIARQHAATAMTDARDLGAAGDPASAGLSAI